MIFKLDDSILENPDNRVLASLVSQASEANQKIDCSDEVWCYIEQNVLNTNYLGKFAIAEIQENTELRDIKTVYRNYFREIIVGNGTNMIDVNIVLQILDNDSYLVLENSRYDWPTIKKWIKIFDGKIGIKYRTVNSIVHKAVETKKILPDHAGGGGSNIINRIETLRTGRYAQIYSYKLSTVFDSDKNGKGDEAHHQELKEYLSANHIVGHELLKREIENYYSWEAYKEAGITKGTALPPKDEEEYDFMDVSKCGRFNYQKSDMESMPQYIKPKRLIERIRNNMGDCNGEYEIQQIIFMLAKII